MKNLWIVLGFLIILIMAFYLDNTTINFLSRYRNPIMTNLFIFIAKYFNYYLLAALILALTLIKKSRKIAIKLGLAFVSSLVGVYILKTIIQRPRPVINLIEALGYSFPSGHTTVMFSLLYLIWNNFEQKYIKYTWLIIAVIIAFSRMYLNVHYFTDIIGGIIFGLIIGKSISKI